MKISNIFYIVTLITSLITFPLISGNAVLTHSSPSFMQQLSSCGQRLKNLAKFAVMTSALLSPEVAGRSFTEPSSTVPDIIQTPFNGNLSCVGINPIKPEVVFGTNNLISFVNINAPDEPDVLEFEGEDYKSINYLAYNPQATLLAIESCIESCDTSHISILNLTTKTIQNRFKTPTSIVFPLLFNIEGTELIMRSNFFKQNSLNYIIWNTYTNKTTIVPHAGANGLVYIARLFNENLFIMNGVKNIVTWSLDNPGTRTKLDISSANNTIFGGNEEQFSYYCPVVGGIIYLQNGKTITGVQFSNNQYDSVSGNSYCPEIDQFIFTSGDFMATTADAAYVLDPHTAEFKQLYNLSTASNLPQLSSDGCKLFTLKDTNQNTIEFSLIDFAQQGRL